MLAQYSLDSNYRQSKTPNMVPFLENNGVEEVVTTKEIDVQIYGGYTKQYLNNYVSYLQSETGDSTITGNIITLAELKTLGCEIDEDYVSLLEELRANTCKNSPYISWLANGESWWTRSKDLGSLAAPEFRHISQYTISGDGSVGIDIGGVNNVRPIITISKAALKNYLNN